MARHLWKKKILREARSEILVMGLWEIARSKSGETWELQVGPTNGLISPRRMFRSVDLTVWVILEALKFSIPAGTQVQWKKSAEIRKRRSAAGAQIHRPRSVADAEGCRQFIGHRAQVCRKSVRHSVWVRRSSVGNSAYLYVGVIWMKLRTPHETYLAVPVYCCLLGFEVMSGFWY